jgi:kinetochore protein NNF1
MADPKVISSGSLAKNTSSNDSARSKSTPATSQQASQQATASAATGEEEPKSPPLPARHIAITPGPRATRLQEAYSSSLSHTLSRLGWENFAACYPTIAAQAPDTLRHVQKQMVERLGLLCEVRESWSTLR